MIESRATIDAQGLRLSELRAPYQKWCGALKTFVEDGVLVEHEFIARGGQIIAAASRYTTEEALEKDLPHVRTAHAKAIQKLLAEIEEGIQ